MSFDFERDYLWMGLVAASGLQGRAWVEVYRQEGQDIGSTLRDALAMLRRQQMAQGYELLERARTRILTLEPSRASIFDRFYFGGLSFYHFCQKDYDSALEALGAANDSIRAAVEAETCLLPFAAVSIDIPLKMAQIERTRRRWSSMATHVAKLRALLSDQQPLCVLKDGRMVDHRLIGELVAARPLPGEELRPAVEYLLDASLRAEVLEHLVAGLYALPDLLIPSA